MIEPVEILPALGADHPDDGPAAEHEDAEPDEAYDGEFPEIEPDDSEPPR